MEPKLGTETCNWMTNRFPRALKDRFIATARARGSTSRELLVYILTCYIQQDSQQLGGIEKFYNQRGRVNRHASKI